MYSMSGKMSELASNRQKPQYGSWKSTRLFTYCSHHHLLSPYSINIFYFVSLSFLGFVILKALDPQTAGRPRNIDLFFTSVSATTVSSMITVEMEVFSNGQLIVMTVLMFVGGEVFTSMVGLLLGHPKVISKERVEHESSNMNVMVPNSGSYPFVSKTDLMPSSDPFTEYMSCKKFMGLVVLGYLLVIHVLGITSVLLYLACVQTASEVLRNKGLKTLTFAVFTAVSTFANCGFIPTNENMVVFSRNSGLLWILIPQILLGNTLFPPALRVVLWGLRKSFRMSEAKYLLQNSTRAGYCHLLPAMHSICLAATVFGFVLVGLALFCYLEWNSAVFSGSSTYQKAVAIVFECVNARHSGETVVDLSAIAPAILVFFIFMMYLPPYTLFLPIKENKQSSILESGGRNSMTKTLIFSSLTYVVICIILICITERKRLKEDPINFSVLNITFEVISAYGNVGFTTGYSCERRLISDPKCVNKWYGLSGKWTAQGKGILILVMFFGKLKKVQQEWR